MNDEYSSLFSQGLHFSRELGGAKLIRARWQALHPISQIHRCFSANQWLRLCLTLCYPTSLHCHRHGQKQLSKLPELGSSILQAQGFFGNLFHIANGRMFLDYLEPRPCDLGCYSSWITGSRSRMRQMERWSCCSYWMGLLVLWPDLIQLGSHEECPLFGFDPLQHGIH